MAAVEVLEYSSSQSQLLFHSDVYIIIPFNGTITYVSQKYNDIPPKTCPERAVSVVIKEHFC